MSGPQFAPLSEADAATTVDEATVFSWEGQLVSDRYRVLEQIGEGGMGAVYAAEHLLLRKHVAIKVVLPQFARDGNIQARFEREAMATGAIDHPHVASAMDYGSLPDGGAFLVMQLVRGNSIEDLLGSGAMAWPRVCMLAAQVADGLAAAHAAGIVHRDLKPENVMVEVRDGGVEHARILDFGIAQIRGHADFVSSSTPVANGAALTRVGSIVGTPGYMAPEQALNEGTDFQTDLYSLGVLIWEMISGDRLFTGEDVQSLVVNQVSGKKSPRLRAVSGDSTVPIELQHLLDQLLERDPKKRPPNAGGVRDRLQGFAIEGGREDSRLVGRFTPLGGALDRTPTRIGPRLIGVMMLGAVLLTGIILAVMSAVRPPGDETQIGENESVEEIFQRAREANWAEELERQQDMLLHDENKTVRRQAGLFVLDYEPADQVPLHIRALAEMATASGCAELHEALTHVRETADPRVRPSVQRLEDTPRTCRNRRRRRVHCYACVRTDLREILDSLPESPRPENVAPVTPE